MQKRKKYLKSKGSHHILHESGSVAYSGQFYALAQHYISKDYIKAVLKNAKLSLDEFIGIVPISIDSYKRKTEFKPPVTEKVLEIQEVYQNGLNTFGESFYSWMDTTNVALGNVKPKELLVNSFGVRLLLDEIGRMEHGILS